MPMSDSVIRIKMMGKIFFKPLFFVCLMRAFRPSCKVIQKAQRGTPFCALPERVLTKVSQRKGISG